MLEIVNEDQSENSLKVTFQTDQREFRSCQLEVSRDHHIFLDEKAFWFFLASKRTTQNYLNKHIYKHKLLIHKYYRYTKLFSGNIINKALGAFAQFMLI
jgi:hypothetical protein